MTLHRNDIDATDDSNRAFVITKSTRVLQSISEFFDTLRSSDFYDAEKLTLAEDFIRPDRILIHSAFTKAKSVWENIPTLHVGIKEASENAELQIIAHYRAFTNTYESFDSLGLSARQECYDAITYINELKKYLTTLSKDSNVLFVTNHAVRDDLTKWIRSSAEDIRDIEQVIDILQRVLPRYSDKVPTMRNKSSHDAE